AGGPAIRNLDTSPEERARFTLSDAEVLQLARWTCRVEQHYGCAMDIEWAKDGETGGLFIVQARPETVQSRRQRGLLRSWKVEPGHERLLSGLAVGQAVVSAPICLIRSA